VDCEVCESLAEDLSTFAKSDVSLFGMAVEAGKMAGDRLQPLVMSRIRLPRSLLERVYVLRHSSNAGSQYSPAV
jgi:hypothetical protein